MFVLEGGAHQPLCVMSSSMDKTIVIWRFDSQSGMWVDEVRVHIIHQL